MVFYGIFKTFNQFFKVLFHELFEILIVAVLIVVIIIVTITNGLKVCLSKGLFKME